LKRAQETDPLNLVFSGNLAMSYADARKYDLAVEQFKKAFEMDANGALHGNYAVVALDMKNYDLWLQEWHKAAVVSGDKEDQAMAEEVARVYAKSGPRAAQQKVVQLQLDLAKRRYVDPALIAYNYADLDMRDETFKWLEKGFAEKSESIQFIKAVATMEKYHSDPRYLSLLKRMGLPA